MSEQQEDRRRDRPLSPSEVAGELGLHPVTVRILCRQGVMGRKVGGRWMIPVADVEAIKAGSLKLEGAA